mgnify:FL=1
MFTTLRMKNLGPHEDRRIALLPAGVTRWAEPSQAGKSLAIEAACFLLLGTGSDGAPFPAEAIRDGGDRLTVEGVTVKGTTLTKMLNRKRTVTRAIEPAGGKMTAFANEADYAAKLGRIVASPLLTRVIMVPLLWRELLTAELGRPLRDLLLAILPPGDLRAAVAERVELREGDPLDESKASSLLCEARAIVATRERTLAIASARAEGGAALVLAPSVGEVAAAYEVQALVAAWAAADARTARQASAKATYEERCSARDRWRERFAALGERPPYDAATMQAWKVKREGFWREATAARGRAGSVRSELAVAGSRAADLTAQLTEAKAAGDCCPTCKRPEWAEAKAQHEALALAVKRAAAALKAAGQVVKEAEAASATAGVALAAPDAAQPDDRAAVAYEAALRALGPEPTVPRPPEPVVAPATPRPSEGDIEQAGAILHRHRAATPQHGIADAGPSIADAQATYADAMEDADRLAALLDAIRQAPSALAEKQVVALGNLGPVTLRFPEKQNRATPEIEVRVDGRAWTLASEGRMIYADACFRAAIRRAAKMGPLPIFVDRRQSWSGDDPPVEGPVVYLVTAREET